MVDGLPFGARVRERRRALDLTQEELARRVGCASVTLRKIEGGHLRASRQIAERLAVALGIPLEEREAFVRAARSALVERGESRESTPSRTPLLSPEEIGSDDLSGRAIRSYLLGERIGAGGFGAVYRAVQPSIDRQVAIKLILPRFADHPDFIRRFEAEARLVARLEHPHIVPLYDYWRDPGFAFLVMRYLRGGSLTTQLAAGPLSPQRILQLAEQIGAALHVAHRVGVVHRDLKPSNILLDEEGNAFLADFGIAKDLALPAPEQTIAGAFVGSPAYSSPEQLRAEPVTPQADIYAFGVLLYELLTGQRPFHGPTPAALIQQQLTSSLPRLAETYPGLGTPLDHILQRATAKLPGARYPDVTALLAELREVLADRPAQTLVRQNGASQAAPPTLVLDVEDSDNPYKGLQAFDEADAEDYFGRETLVHQLLSRIGEGSELSRFLALIGPSGSGKSSLARAGLLPALRRGGLPGSESWYVVTLTPGARPLDELAGQLRSVAPLGVEADDLRALLGADERGLLRAARLVLPAEPQTELLLLIDQFEELFTLCEDRGQRAHVLRSLVTAILDERSRLRVIVTLRADFIDQALLDVDFGELLRQRGELVLPLTAEELERAIVGPAQRLGLALEDGLVATMIADVGAQPGALPLLQHALSELFHRRRGRVLTRSAYAELGGVSGALAASVEGLYQQLSAEDQNAVRQLLLRLVTPGLGVADTRRRARRAELIEVLGEEAFETVGGAFEKARLLTFDHDPASREATVEVGHETLLHAWPRLRDWIAESREALLAERRLALTATEWERSGREPSFLASGARLEQFAALSAGGQLVLSGEEQAYLAASEALRDTLQAEEEARRQRELEVVRTLAHEQEQRAREAQAAAASQQRIAKRLRGVVAGLVAVLLVAIGLVAYSLQQRGAAITAREAADQEAAVATSRELAVAAANNLAVDPERSILLALHGLEQAETDQAVEALHRAVLATRIERALPVHKGTVAATVYSPDGGQLATIDSKGAITIWDPSRGVELNHLQGYAVAYSPDSRTLGTLALDDTVALYDVTSGTPIRTLGKHALAWNIHFRPDGNRVATGGDDMTVKLWDVTREGELFTLEGHTGPVSGLSFDPDGTRMMSAGQDGKVFIWNVADGTQRLSIESGTVLNGAAFSPDGVLIASSGADGTVYLWDSATGEQLQAFAQHGNRIGGVIFSADAASIMSFSYDGTAKLWDVASGDVRLSLSHGSPIHSAALSSDETHLVTGSTDGSVKIWDIRPAGSREILSLPHSAIIWRIDYSPDGALLATAGWDGGVHLYDAQNGAQRWARKLYDGRAMDVRFSPDGTRLVSAGEDGLIHILNADTGAEVLTLRGHGDGLLGGIFVGAIAAGFSPDGRYIASAGADGTARLWDASSGKQIWSVNPGSGVTNVAFSPNGSLLATTTDFGGLVEWDVQSGERRRVYVEGSEEGPRLWALSYNPDGRSLAAAGFGGEAGVWDTQTGVVRLRLSGLSTTVAGLTYSADGGLLLLGSGEGTRLYDANSGALLLGLEAAGGMRDTAFRPGSAHMAVAGNDGLVRVITRDLEELRTIARSRLTRSLREEECTQYLHMPSCPATP